MKPYHVWHFVSGFFHVVSYFQGSCSPMLQYFHWWIVRLFPFSIIILLLIILLQTFMHKFLCKYMFSIILDRYLGVKLLNNMVILYLTTWGNVKLLNCFPNVLHHFTTSLSMYEASNFSTFLQHLLLSIF